MKEEHRINRRHFLNYALTGCATTMLGPITKLCLAAEFHNGHPLAPKLTHHPAKAKNLIFVFLTGGFSHVDTFDYKPKLQQDHGKEIPAWGNTTQPAKGSPFKFQPYGESGLMISELFPHLGGIVDDLCVIRSMHTDLVEHFQATLAMHTGSATVPMPSIGAWLSYGLGTENLDLPSYMVLCERIPYSGSQVWDSHFLPPVHQGVRVIPGHEPISNLKSNSRSLKLAELERIMLHDVNEIHAQQRPGDLELRARMNADNTAKGMARAAPQMFDVSKESDATLNLYGLKRDDNKSFAWQCLVARRMVEHGVRVVELIDTGSNDNWDAHGNMEEHRPKARRVDLPLSALVKDLKQRGMFDETLIAICTEFGRTPFSDGVGRNHHGTAFTCLLAGAGIKGGVAYGESDEYGLGIVSQPCHVHDYHATILHLMGIDHTKLTYRYGGRDFRLTDVHGKIISEVLA